MIFGHAEEVVSVPTKRAISEWLLSLEVREGFTVLGSFASVFDRIFGSRHLSWRCFGMSCLASLVSVAILSMVWLARNHDEATASTGAGTAEVIGWVAVYLPGVIGFSLCFNLLPDYISLLKTRGIIRILKVSASTSLIITWIILDALGSVAISLLATAPLAWLFSFAADIPAPETLKTLYGGLTEVLSLSSNGLYGIFLYSTFFTSAWLWLYASSGALIKLGEYIGVGFSRFKSILDIKEKPLRSLGAIACVLVTILYIGVAIFKWII